MAPRQKKKKFLPKKKKIVVRRKARKAPKPLRKRALSRESAPQAVLTHSVPEPAHEDNRLPSFYNEDRLTLLVRDPWWLFSYWEITPQLEKKVLAGMESKHRADKKTVLRVYDVTGVALPASHSFFDIELNFFTNNWYIDVGRPAREWMLELGYRAGGRFYPLIRSNRVQTPSFGISDVLDEEWMLPDDIYYRLIGRSLGSESTGGSMDIRKLLEKYLRNVVSSERLPESSKKVSQLA